MNPNVASMISAMPFSPVKHVWFDLSDEEPLQARMARWMDGRTLREAMHNDYFNEIPMPFESIALLIPVGLRMGDDSIAQKQMLMTAERSAEHLSFKFWSKRYKRPIVETTISDRLLEKPSGMEVNPDFAKDAKIDAPAMTDRILSIIKFALPIFCSLCYTANRENLEVQGYKCTPNPTNKNRIKRGKRPLFEWETVTIGVAPRVESVSQGGTHASPKPHDRRGHQRRYKNGKVVYIKPCTINKHKIKNEGFIHHDYKVKGAA